MLHEGNQHVVDR